MSPSEALLIFTLGLAAWLISTLGAGGGAILLLPIGGWLIDARDLPPVIAIASVAGSVQRCVLYRRDIESRILRANVPGLILGSVCGAALLGSIDASLLTIFVGSFLVLYAVSQLMGWGVSLPRPRPLHFGAASFVTATLSAVVGAAGPLMNPFYLHAGVTKQRMIGTKAASTLLMQIAKLVSFGAAGLLRPEVLSYGLALAVGAFVGNVLGKRALAHMSAARFARVVQGMLLVAGLLTLAKLLQ